MTKHLQFRLALASPSMPQRGQTYIQPWFGRCLKEREVIAEIQNREIRETLSVANSQLSSDWWLLKPAAVRRPGRYQYARLHRHQRRQQVIGHEANYERDSRCSSRETNRDNPLNGNHFDRVSPIAKKRVILGDSNVFSV